MKILGLTGGIGMGKSTAAKILQTRGVPVVDTDGIAREIVEPGQPALEEIVSIFGLAIVSTNGHLRRDELARVVFGDSIALKKLEAILHPRIRQAWLQKIKTWRADGVPQAVVVIPLLFETEAEKHFDATICVACSAAAQQTRLIARGWDVPQIEKRCAAQWPVAKKMEASKYVVWTEGSMEAHAEQLERLLALPG